MTKSTFGITRETGLCPPGMRLSHLLDYSPCNAPCPISVHGMCNKEQPESWAQLMLHQVKGRLHSSLIPWTKREWIRPQSRVRNFSLSTLLADSLVSFYSIPNHCLLSHQCQSCPQQGRIIIKFPELSLV